MKYTVTITRPARKQLDLLQPDVHSRILRRLESLADNPRPPGVEKLGGQDDQYRVRVGDWRIIYTVRDRQLIVLVLKIGNRREVYR
ncbi:MAG: type II toxin-antitoxin system RelE/ParE family toxin [bacterium]